jgi:hypothetical protein
MEYVRDFMASGLLRNNFMTRKTSFTNSKEVELRGLEQNDLVELLRPRRETEQLYNTGCMIRLISDLLKGW